MNGGVVLAAPKLVVITFDSDANRDAIEGMASWLASTHLPAVGTEYGIGAGTTTNVHATAPPQFDQFSTAAWLTSALDGGTVPPSASDQMYVLIVPVSCADSDTVGEGYHIAWSDPQFGQLVMAVVGSCGEARGVEVSLSHEVIEGAADPLFLTGWAIADANDPWHFHGGGEIADLCDDTDPSLVGHDASGQYSTQLTWSNAAAKASQPPCVPWPEGQVYLWLQAEPRATVSVAAGSSVSFTLTGWASAPHAEWSLFTLPGNFGVTFEPLPTLSKRTVGVGEQVTLTLDVPSTTPSGSYGAVQVICQDNRPVTRSGSVMVAVVVE